MEDPGAGGDSEVEHDLLRLAAPRSMLVRKRRRHGPCRRQALLALLALGCVLLMLGALQGSKRPASRLERRAESLASPRDEA